MCVFIDFVLGFCVLTVEYACQFAEEGLLLWLVDLMHVTLAGVGAKIGFFVALRSVGAFRVVSCAAHVCLLLCVFFFI